MKSPKKNEVTSAELSVLLDRYGVSQDHESYYWVQISTDSSPRLIRKESLVPDADYQQIVPAFTADELAKVFILAIVEGWFDKRKPRELIDEKKAKVRFQALKRDHFTCQRCGRTTMTNDPAKRIRAPLDAEYLVAPENGGEDTLENVITVCWECRNREGEMLNAIREGEMLYE